MLMSKTNVQSNESMNRETRHATASRRRVRDAARTCAESLELRRMLSTALVSPTADPTPAAVPGTVQALTNDPGGVSFAHAFGDGSLVGRAPIIDSNPVAALEELLSNVVDEG